MDKTITEDYVSYKVALLLKEKGFSSNTIGKYAGAEGITEKWYDDYRERVLRFSWNEGYLVEPLTEPQDQYEIIGDTIPAPTHQMAMKWLREVHNIFIQVELYSKHDDYCFEVFKNTHRMIVEKDEVYNSYEQAVEEAIKYCLINLIE